MKDPHFNEGLEQVGYRFFLFLTWSRIAHIYRG